MKKLFTLVLSLLCIQLAHGKGTKIGELYYVLNDEDLTAEVTYDTIDKPSSYGAYQNFNSGYIITIPATVQNGDKTYKVTSVGEYAFYNCKKPSRVYFPTSLTSIGDHAFYECSGLTGQLNLPESLTLIGDYAFWRCSGLSGQFNLPQGVTSIGRSAFFYCKGLTGQFNLPQQVTSIGDYAFMQCEGLTGQLNIPQSLTSIGEYAFGGCEGLTGQLNIPLSLTSIGEFAFTSCSGLTQLNLPQGVTSIGKGVFYECSGLTQLNLPESLTSIGENAFSLCKGLTQLNLPLGVTSIGNGAFNGCSGLTGQLNLPESLTSIGENAFSGCEGITSAIIPKNVKEVVCFNRCTNLTSVTLPYGVTKVGGFVDCTSLKNIDFPETVIEIDDKVDLTGSGPFGRCYSLTSVTIPRGVKKIKNSFKDCTALSSVTFQEGLVSIEGKDSFSGCLNLTSVSFPEGIETIQGFNDCPNISSVSFPEGIESIEGFNNCPNITSVSFPEGLKSITGFASNDYYYDNPGTSNLTSVSLPESLTSISGFNGLTSITLPKNVNSVNIRSTKLTEITVENPVPFSDFQLYYLPQYSQVTIKVPTDSWQQYRTTKPWSEYSKIVPMDGFKGSLSAENFEINSNEEVTFPVSVSFNPECAYSGVQFDVQLPNSLQFVSAGLNNELQSAAFKLDTEAKENNTTRVLVTPTSNLDGVTTTENIILLTVKADSNAEAATETIKFTKGYVSNIYGQDINLTDAETQVTILSSIRSITIDPQVYDVKPGGSVEITAKVEPANASNTDLIWTIDYNYGDFIIVGSGLSATLFVAPHTELGTKTLTATSPNDENIKATATINVIGTAYITALKNEIKVKEKLELIANVQEYFNSSILKFNWTSSNPEYATVDPTTGLVTGVAPGTTTITATLNDNYFKATPATFEVTVQPILLGDANDNGYVTVADVVTIADHIAEKPTYDWCEPNADVNDDNQITVADVNGTINIIMGKEPTTMRSAARKLNSINDYLVVDNFIPVYDQSLNIGVHLDNSIEYSALQAAFMIPEGMTVESVNTGSRASNHSLVYNITDDNKLIVVLYSLTNESFNANGSELLNIQVTADALCGDLRVENIHASDVNSFDYELAVAGGKNQGVVTGLDSLDCFDPAVVGYAEGLKVLNAEGADIYIYSIAGEILASEKAQSNVVMFPMAKGIYIVTINGKTFKIKI